MWSKEKRAEYNRKYRAVHSDWRAAWNKKYRLSHCHLDSYKKTENAHRNAETTWVHDLKRYYNLTKEEFFKMLKEQDNKCAICHKEFTKRPCVDHNHITGKVRGILCNHCNSALGFFEDNPERISKAIEYLSRF